MTQQHQPGLQTLAQMEAFDNSHLWHPYSAMSAAAPPFPVVSANGVYLHLADGRVLVDGMSSWWAAIHGYNHPVLNEALHRQTENMAHVMFGGLTHSPAISLGQRMLTVLPSELECIFFCDSGSVAVEVAIKMALQYWITQDMPQRRKLISLRYGYHGDTFGAMSVSDPDNGMHWMFAHLLPQQIFARAPECLDIKSCAERNTEISIEAAVADMEAKLKQHGDEIAAVIVEPVVQGAGGMRIYHPMYLQQIKQLCERFDVLLIFDEIATGFGRTGKMFASEHAAVTADIVCVGKALSAGYISLAATVTTAQIAAVIDAGTPGVLMHGPTYMANPLACAVACANLDILATGLWQTQVAAIEAQLRDELTPCAQLDQVESVRIQGAIGIVEMRQAVNVSTLCQDFVNQGVWVRPFGKLIYLMPPYIVQADELSKLTQAVVKVCHSL